MNRYYRDYAQTVSNGNTTSYEACTNTPGILCQPDGVTPLMNSAGQTLPDISNGGTQIIGENDFELIHAWGGAASLINQHANPSSFRDGPIDSPSRGRDVRLEAQTPDDLLERCINALRCHGLRRHGHLVRVRDIRTIHAAQSQSGLRESVKQE